MAHEVHHRSARCREKPLDVVGKVEPPHFGRLKWRYLADVGFLARVDIAVAIHFEKFIAWVAHEGPVVVAPVIITKDVIEPGHTVGKYDRIGRLWRGCGRYTLVAGKNGEYSQQGQGP